MYILYNSGHTYIVVCCTYVYKSGYNSLTEFLFLLQRIPKWFKLEKDSGRKFPEGIWNLSIYTVAWIWVAGIVIYHKKSLFFRLSSHWQSK